MGKCSNNGNACQTDVQCGWGTCDPFDPNNPVCVEGADCIDSSECWLGVCNASKKCTSCVACQRLMTYVWTDV